MPPTQLLLWSQGRTACHLLERMLSNQENSQPLWHPMQPARLHGQIPLWTEESPKTGLQEDLRKNYIDLAAQGVARWEKAWQDSQSKGQTLFMHEHPQFALEPQVGLDYGAHGWKEAYPGPSNFTLFPDDLLFKPGTCAIFTTRHPAWVVPAACRALRDAERNLGRLQLIIVCCMRWQRQMYDFYVANNTKAIIVEAEDYMTNPDIVRKLCSEAGLDPQRALFNWPKATEEEKAALPQVVLDLLHTLMNSTGLIPSKAKPPPSVDEEHKLWKEEFGEEQAGFIRELVDAAMPDYEYLRERKLKL